MTFLAKPTKIKDVEDGRGLAGNGSTVGQALLSHVGGEIIRQLVRRREAVWTVLPISQKRD